jgi:hypothetical protein
MRFLVGFGIALTFLARVACAEETRPLIVGPGTISCATFSAQPAPQIAEVTTWAQGFLSGMNSYRWLSTHYQPLVLPDAAEIHEHLRRYCVEHPLDTLRSRARSRSLRNLKIGSRGVISGISMAVNVLSRDRLCRRRRRQGSSTRDANRPTPISLRSISGALGSAFAI